MAVSKHILDLITLALQDRVLTFKERQTIVEAAEKEGTATAEVNAVMDNMLEQRLKNYTKEELGSCPNCGHGVPLFADECPYCGTVLKHIESQPVVPPPYISATDDAAATILSENIRVEQEKQTITKCPKCHAPFPLFGNVCPHCQYIVHTREDSKVNATTMIAKMKASIETLRNAPLPSFGQVLWHRLGLILFYIASSLLILGLLGASFTSAIYTLSAIALFPISLLMLFFALAGKKKSPVQIADEMYYNGLHDYEMYSRQTDTLYGNSDEAKTLLYSYAAEIKRHKANRTSNRNKITAIFVAWLIVPVVLYMFSTSGTQSYQDNRNEYPEYYEMSEYTKTLHPMPECPVYEIYNDYIAVEGDAELMFDVNTPWYDIRLKSPEKTSFSLRLDPVKLRSTGKKVPNADTCTLYVYLFDKDKKLIDDDLCPLKIEYRNAEYNYQTFLGNGGGNYNAEFLSIQASKSAERLRQVAERAHYFIVY